MALRSNAGSSCNMPNALLHVRQRSALIFPLFVIMVDGEAPCAVACRLTESAQAFLFGKHGVVLGLRYAVVGFEI